MLSPGMSAAVATTTFDQSTSGSSSIASSFARASVERIVMPCQAPGKTRSSVYFAAPVSFAGPSRRSGKPGGATRHALAGIDDERALHRPDAGREGASGHRAGDYHRAMGASTWSGIPRGALAVDIAIKVATVILLGMGRAQPGPPAVPGQGVHRPRRRLPDRAARPTGRVVAARAGARSRSRSCRTS